MGICTSGSTDGHAVEVDGVAHHGHGGKDGTPEGRPSAPGKSGPIIYGAPGTIACWTDTLCFERGADVGPPPEPAAGDDEPAAQVTIEDVARFLPAVARVHAEPDGWAVVGVPANYWIDVDPMIVHGEVLDTAVDVRFTPRSYRWVYGDGTRRQTATPGASWAALGQQELTRTATSHRYADRGEVRVHVEVLFTAAYRVQGGGWIAIDGAVQGDSPEQPVLVVTERTVVTNGA